MSERSTVGIRDVARHLNMSISTVSRALNGRPDASLETRERVRLVAAQLGYFANHFGRTLRSGVTGSKVPGRKAHSPYHPRRMVSSKNELAIANILYGLEREGYLTYQVEPRLPFDDGRGRWADFLIEAKGENWYWEHCGRMDDENYRRRWERKKELYARNDFTIYGVTNPKGRLIVTEDGSGRGLDSQVIEQLARTLFAD